MILVEYSKASRPRGYRNYTNFNNPLKLIKSIVKLSAEEVLYL